MENAGGTLPRRPVWLHLRWKRPKLIWRWSAGFFSLWAFHMLRVKFFQNIEPNTCSWFSLFVSCAIVSVVTRAGLKR